MKDIIYKQCKTENERHLLRIISNIIWMAARYAHGRHTYAPGIIRETVKELKTMYKDFEVDQDKIIEKPKKEDIKGMTFRNDYLDDIFNYK